MQQTTINQCLAIKYARNIKEICKPFFKHIGIRSFRYTRLYKDGTCATLISNAKWQEFVLKTNFFKTLPLIFPSHGIWFLATNICLKRYVSVNRVWPLRDFLIINYPYENYQEFFL